ncbi:MAG TPA: UrcA family protein [Hyphomonadaceae bacterium]|jgi:UrcA family protein|nr:UrcA family protein [Hyphomonadaceae bacterium]
MTGNLISSILPRTALAVVLAALALPALAGSAAADTPQRGKVRLGWNIKARYSAVDLERPVGRAALLAGVEKAAHKLCDGAMVRSDRRACEQHVVATIMTNASETERTALSLAQLERNTVAQAMR